MKPKEIEKKLRAFLYVGLGLLAILAVKLVFVQFVQNAEYEMLAKENSIRLVVIKAPRGEIYDRNGAILAKNRRVYSVSLAYLGVKNVDAVVRELVKILGPKYPEVTVEYVQSLLEKQKYRLFEPVTIVRDVDWATIVHLKEHRQELPGVEVDVEPLRYYPENTLAGHIFGYVHPIYDTAELDRYYDRINYRVGDLVGKNGIEKVYEPYLRGKDGARQVEVNVSGNPIRELVTMEPKGGNNLVLTIDRNLQKVMDNTMDQVMATLQRSNPKAKAGAAVLINVKTGEILAMSSQPPLDPNAFTKHMDQATLNYYFPQGAYDPRNPGATINRVIQTAYPPGSTFKPITGMAALLSGNLQPVNDTVVCRGAYWISPYIKCWGVHGTVGFYKGMAMSCNVFFQEAGRRAGKENIIKVARLFGLGQKTGIDLPYETTGLVPDPVWKKNVNGAMIDRKYDTRKKATIRDYDQRINNAADEEERKKILREKERQLKHLEEMHDIEYRFTTAWQPYDTFNMSIGQGGNSYSVIQLVRYVAALANDGVMMQPHVVKRIVSQNGKTIKTFEPVEQARIDLDPWVMDETKKAMKAVASPGGTAYSIFAAIPPEIGAAAKTGTAQPGRRGDSGSRDYHGVFIAFAPYENPEIAYAGIIEYGYHGGSSAGLVAKAVFEQYFGVKDHLNEPKTPITLEGESDIIE